MDKEEVLSLIQESLSALKSELLSEVDKKNSGLGSSLTKEFKKTIESLKSNPIEESEESKEKLTLKALQQQLADLNNQLKAKDEEAYRAKKSQVVTQEIAKADLLNQSAFYKLFMLENGDYLKEENGSWFIDKSGEISTLGDSIKNYLTTDEGKLFIPASKVQGASSQETKPIPQVNNNKPSAGEALMRAFSDI
ncbi:hypothetical protein Nos7524_3196 [Nostoc sp. PCC 7524]|uniref:hypothetical protein n=1 Tax=Nostoc sp. (strain ATCC 29411 / PCC 7524) TaxID=28072 RepID=UPI00029F0838|nr:hypothetical protein [Nostoc sp. PCC 7524]AFY48996.1 hypothetical protein Nos7524_3196 [Nostoc sp. PCC 7524]